MREWEGALERFYEGDADRSLLEGMSDLDDAAGGALAEALQLADGLVALCKALEPPGTLALGELLGEEPVLLEDEGESSEEREALLGADLSRLLGSMPGPPPISELSLPDLVGPETSEGTAAPVLLGSFPRSLCQQDAAEPSRRLLEEVVEQCDAAEATLWVVSEDRTKLQGALNHVRGGKPHEALEGIAVPLSVSAIGTVAQTGQPASITREDYQDPIVSWTVGVEVTAMIAAPIKVADSVVGVLSAVNPAVGESFGPKALGHLEWRAYLLGLVLQESRQQAPIRLRDRPII